MASVGGQYFLGYFAVTHLGRPKDRVLEVMMVVRLGKSGAGRGAKKDV